MWLCLLVIKSADKTLLPDCFSFCASSEYGRIALSLAEDRLAHEWQIRKFTEIVLVRPLASENGVSWLDGVH